MSKQKTMKVWVMPHDDETVRYVINTVDDMKANFDELLDGEGDPITIREVAYDRHEVLYAVDQMRYLDEFRAYCTTWTEVRVPIDLYYAADEAPLHAVIDQKLGA